MKSKNLIISNPLAGTKNNSKVVDRLLAALAPTQTDTRLCETKFRGHGEILAKDASVDGISTIIALGGDGTINEVVNGIKLSDSNRKQPNLCILPVGRCNNFAKSLNISNDVSLLVNLLTSKSTRTVDLGKIGERYFLTVAAFGFDAQVAEYVDAGYHPKFLKGTFAYLYGFIATLPGYVSKNVMLSGDFGSLEMPVFLVAIANTSTYGGGFNIAPGATPFDGILNLCIVKHVSKLEVLKVLPLVFAGKHTSHPSVLSRITKTLDIQTDIPGWIWADGERISKTPTSINIEKSSLSVISPK